MSKEEFKRLIVLENIKAGGVYSIDELEEFVDFVYDETRESIKV